VRCLLDHPSAAAIIDHRGMNNRTALWSACEGGYAPVVRALLEKGADPTIADSWGKTPMDVAKEKHRLACIEALSVECSLRPRSPLAC
jgi:ankyrin repeat protein